MMEGLDLLCFDLSSAETDFWWLEDEDFAYFRVRMTFYVRRGSGQARLYPRRWLFLSSRVKTSTLQGRHRRFVGDSAFHTSLRGAPPLVGEQQKWYQQILEKVQNLVPHDYIKSCTVYAVVQQYVCVRVCVLLPIHSGHKLVGRFSRGHTGGRSHRISHPPSLCDAFLNFSREKDSAIPFPRRP